MLKRRNESAFDGVYGLVAEVIEAPEEYEKALTAAHRTLPFGTHVQVTNLSNGRSVVVTITDRGPFARGRVIDVSRRAARKLAFLRDGTTRVRLEVVE